MSLQVYIAVHGGNGVSNEAVCLEYTEGPLGPWQGPLWKAAPFHFSETMNSDSVEDMSTHIPPLPNVTTDPQPQSATFAHQAAKGSWASAVIVALLLTLGRNIVAQVVLELLALSLMVVGLGLGTAALFGIRKHGK